VTQCFRGEWTYHIDHIKILLFWNFLIVTLTLTCWNPSGVVAPISQLIKFDSSVQPFWKDRICYNNKQYKNLLMYLFIIQGNIMWTICQTGWSFINWNTTLYFLHREREMTKIDRVWNCNEDLLKLSLTNRMHFSI
jgi:hypothetical protein